MSTATWLVCGSPAILSNIWIKATGLICLCSWRRFTCHPEGLNWMQAETSSRTKKKKSSYLDSNIFRVTDSYSSSIQMGCVIFHIAISLAQTFHISAVLFGPHHTHPDQWLMASSESDWHISTRHDPILHCIWATQHLPYPMSNLVYEVWTRPGLYNTCQNFGTLLAHISFPSAGTEPQVPKIAPVMT